MNSTLSVEEPKKYDSSRAMSKELILAEQYEKQF